MVRTYAGRGVGAFIENQLFASQTPFILVCSPWISPTYAHRLMQAAYRGVNVMIITSDSPEPNHQQSLQLLTSYITPPRDWLGRPKKDWVPPPLQLLIVRERFIHAKLYVVDGYAVAGSPNLTEAGLYHNVEHVTIFEGEEAEKLVEDFRQLWALYHERAAQEVAQAPTPVQKAFGVLESIIQRFKIF